MNLKTLEKALRASWGKDSCYPPMRKDYDGSRPSYGQCHGTALIVNDYFGGKIFEVEFPEGEGHYWNLIDGKEVDLTRDQFDPDQVFPKPQIIGREDTKESKEYFILKKRVKEYLKKQKFA